MLIAKIKLLAHQYLPPHEYSIYFDARLIIKPGLIDDRMQLINTGYEWISFRHRHRKSVVSETIVAVVYSKMTLHSAVKTIKDLNKLNHKEHKNILSENGCIGRKNNKEVNKICNIWAEETKRLRCRDQPSLIIALNRYNKENVKRYIAKSMDNQDNITITRRTEKSVNYKKAIVILRGIYLWPILWCWNLITRIRYKIRGTNNI